MRADNSYYAWLYKIAHMTPNTKEEQEKIHQMFKDIIDILEDGVTKTAVKSALGTFNEVLKV